MWPHRIFCSEVGVTWQLQLKKKQNKQTLMKNQNNYPKQTNRKETQTKKKPQQTNQPVGIFKSVFETSPWGKFGNNVFFILLALR